MPEKMTDVQRITAIASDPMLSGAAPEPSVEGGGEGAGAQNIGGGAQGAGASAAPAAKKYTFRTPDGKVYEAKVGDDGTIVMPDIDRVLKDPHDHYKRHFSSVEERNMSKARTAIRQQELAGLNDTIRSFAERMEAFEGTRRAADSKVEATSADTFDWTQVDANDPLAVAQAMRKEQDMSTKKMLQDMLDERFSRLTEGDRLDATEALGTAYQAWKDYDLNKFKSLLREYGVSVSKDGVDFNKMNPRAVKSIANGMVEHLNTLKQDQARVQTATEKAVAAMPSDDEGPIWDESHTRQLKAYVSEQIESGRPIETDEDCYLIAYEGAKKIINEDIQRVAKMSGRLAKVIAKAKGKGELIAAASPDAKVVVRPDESSGEERDRKRHERMRKDGLNI